MRRRARTQVLKVSALLLLALGAVTRPAAAQRAGEGGGLIDPKSGRFSNVAGQPSRAPDTVAVSEARAFAALPAVFQALAVPLSVVDSASKLMGAVRVPARRPIGGERLSLLLECGTGNYGPNAERYSVQITLLALVRSIDSTHSEVQTRVEGNASPNGISTTVRCSSTGRLEERFTALMRKELGL
jgi:hypothetical protein